MEWNEIQVLRMQETLFFLDESDLMADGLGPRKVADWFDSLGLWKVATKGCVVLLWTDCDGWWASRL